MSHQSLINFSYAISLINILILNDFNKNQDLEISLIMMQLYYSIDFIETFNCFSEML